MSRPARGSLVRTLPLVLLAATIDGRVSVAEPALRSNVDPQLGPYVRMQVARAAERLERGPCVLVLGDFSDVETGRHLAETLAASKRTAGAYLGDLVFRAGPAEGPCRQPLVAAYTSPGSRVVYVCPAGFRRLQSGADQNLPVNVLIHETLHTLGLGENPPTSEEITARVEARCGR